MRMLTHRLQILLDEGRYRRLAREAERRQASVATVIRGAIDLALPASSHESRQAAVAATVEVLQEFAHIRARRRSRQDAAELTRRYADALTVVETSRDDLDRGLDLFTRHPALGAFDALLAGVALLRDARALISADRAFAAVPGLHHVDPATRSLDRLLA